MSSSLIETKLTTMNKNITTIAQDEKGQIMPQPYLIMTNLLYRAFTHFNKTLAEGKLKDCIVTIASAHRKNAYGWHLKDGWKHAGAEMTELNVCAEFLDRDWDEVLETLIHEMAHLKNSQAGIKDCNAVQYHNKNFKTAAESLGLKVEKMRGKGFAETSLGPRAEAAIKSLDITEDEIPKLHRQYKRRVKGTTKTSFIIAGKEDKAEFVNLADKAGLKQPEFFKLLLDVYKEFGEAYHDAHPETKAQPVAQAA